MAGDSSKNNQRPTVWFPVSSAPGHRTADHYRVTGGCNRSRHGRCQALHQRRLHLRLVLRRPATARLRVQVVHQHLVHRCSLHNSATTHAIRNQRSKGHCSGVRVLALATLHLLSLRLHHQGLSCGATVHVTSAIMPRQLLSSNQGSARPGVRMLTSPTFLRAQVDRASRSATVVIVR